MERWSISKLEFLFWWGLPTAILSAPVILIAWLLNHITGGVIQVVVTALAIVIVTVIGTVRAIWILLWSEVG